MSRFADLIQPRSITSFQAEYFGRCPLKLEKAAFSYRRLLNWDLLAEIFESKHANCWLPKDGRLPDASEAGTSGRLTTAEAMQGFTQGRTILIRHSERAQTTLAEIARDFEIEFRAAVDLQLFITPAHGQGFDWHYDIEDVFIIQSTGFKDYFLRKNAAEGRPTQVVPAATLTELHERSCGETEIVRLAPGDALYIPAGHWHKAVAVTDSFHLSIGVLVGDSNSFAEASRLPRKFQ
jgi:50S ribosomal protein L16 3-hydroxylase